MPLFANYVKASFSCSFSYKISQQTDEVVTRGGIMEKKIVNFKLMQIVFTLAIIWQLMSLHEFCGTFADPKAFLQDITVAHCKSFTLIGKDPKSGKFGALFDQDKWHDQFFASSTNDHQPMEEQQHHHQFIDELAAELPPAGRFCIPITISPFDFFSDDIGMDTNLLNNDILLPVSLQFGIALFSLVLLGLGIKTMLCSVGFYEFYVFWYAFPSVIGWCISAALSSRLLLNWTNFWSCYNFRADYTIVPLATLVISIVLACSSVFEIFFMNSPLQKKCPVCAYASTVDDYDDEDYFATECAIE